jgi:hypothetical protein
LGTLGNGYDVESSDSLLEVVFGKVSCLESFTDWEILSYKEGKEGEDRCRENE